MEQQVAAINKAACCYYYERMQDTGSQVHAERPGDGKHDKSAGQVFEGEMADFRDGKDTADKIELNSCDGDFSNQRCNGSTKGLVHRDQEKIE